MSDINTADNGPEIARYRLMRLIRRFEEMTVDLTRAGEIQSAVHVSTGQEAIAVGVCSALGPDDVITSTHRGHGHILAKGGDPARMLAELLGRETGYNKGRGGSMHIADIDLGIFGANGMVGAGAPMACGAAFMFKTRGDRHVAVPFFGDGAMNQGVLLESFNLATMLHLPVVFVCENNGYAVTTPISEVLKGSILDRATGFGLAVEAVDGMDVRGVRAAAERAVERARDGGGPSFLECATYRYSVHNVSAGPGWQDERPEVERLEARAQDPIERLANQLIEEGRWSPDERAQVDGDVESELDGGLGFARNSRRPDPSSAYDFMYARTYAGLPARGVDE
jgi:TPP-dependent pyruvate/acetoin dehydrogenase alpha subunit